MFSLTKTRVNNTQISRIEIVFILLLLLAGIPMLFLIPPGAGYDEEDHLVRVWELSALSFIPGQLSPQEMRYPTVFRDFAYRQQGSSGTVGRDFWQKYGHASLSGDSFVRREIDTKSVYSPGLLLPQAVIMRVFGRSLHLPALPVFYLCRLAGLLSYLLLIWLAIRWMPFGKWILLILSLVPIALFQATTVSPDAISNGIGFLFIAGCLRATKLEEIDWQETWKLVFLVFLLFLAKLNLIPLILLPFLILPPSKYMQKRSYIFLLVMTLILFLVEVAGWNVIAATRSAPLLANEANPTAQLLSILGNPLKFALTLTRDFITNGWTYFQTWINGYGYYYWTPPLIVSLFFLISLGAALVNDSPREKVNRQFRIAFLILFVAGYLATIMSVYLTFTPVGSDQILGMQGRYFVPLALLLLLAVPIPSWKSRFAILSSRWITIFILTALSLNVLGIFLAFYVPCGTTFYQTGLCYRPLFRDFPSEVHASQPISDGRALTQRFLVKCDGLTEVRVLPSVSSPGDNGSTRFMLQNGSSNQTLLDVSIPNNEINTEEWYPLRFEPDWHSAGRQYILSVLGQNPDPGQGITLLYTPQSEFDLGNLYENDQLIEEDIVLQYGCATGLRKLWLTGRP